MSRTISDNSSVDVSIARSGRLVIGSNVIRHRHSSSLETTEWPLQSPMFNQNHGSSNATAGA